MVEPPSQSNRTVAFGDTFILYVIFLFLGSFLLESNCYLLSSVYVFIFWNIVQYIF